MKRYAPLVALVDQLRGEVADLQGQWEALGEELEDKRWRLKLAEATVKMVQQRHERPPRSRRELAGQQRDDSQAQASADF
jgi:hypothetical protein